MPIYVAIADDELDEIELVKEFIEVGFPDKSVIPIVCNDADTIDETIRATIGTDREARVLILFDLKWPGRQQVMAYDVIKKLKAQATTKAWPILVYSSTRAQAEINKCYEANANAFLTKQVQANVKFKREELTSVIKNWVQVQTLPRAG